MSSHEPAGRTKRVSSTLLSIEGGDDMSEEQPVWAPAADSLRRITGRLRATPREPARGQIWRARWDDATQLVAIVATNDELDRVDAVEIRWPDGGLDRFTGVTARQRLRVERAP